MVMPKVLPSSDLRNSMAKVLRELREDGSPRLVTQHGRAVAAMLSIEQYEELMSALEDRLDETDEQLARDVHAARKEIRDGHYRTL